ncbi:MAG TPA: hypothetical protein VHU87_12920 [Rhizomicrobium sp.]|jgi:predicted acetyltransferase|nr:hypothetical protein [Rhizomicrobium sp.]
MRAVLAPLADKPAMWTMLQRYVVEMFAIMGQAHDGGDYAYPGFDSYWSEEGNWPYWAMEGDARAGFALVGREPGWTRMKEFYIPPKFRRGGLGLAFARQIIAAHPGDWKIRQMAVNERAITFWRRAIEEYAFTEARFADKGMDRVEQTVVVPG